MMKMLIQLDEERVRQDGKYRVEDMWRVIDKRFAGECIKEIQSDGSVMYAGDPHKDYFTRINLATFYLKRQKWFADYCIKWIWYDNDDDEDLPFQDIDVLSRMKQKRAVYAR